MRQHGTYACYVDGCRRPECLAENRAYARRYRARTRPDRWTIDEVAVQRAVMGDPPGTLTQPEREEAVRRLHAARLNDRQISDRTGITARTVLRIRNRLGLVTYYPEYRSVAA